jgi:basic amino acid/polyamine antiporter, APA family
VGSGIFINPYLVARQLGRTELILLAWAGGGVQALLGGFIWAEVASRMPAVGGQYAYLRETFHPGVAFAYGWTLLPVTQTGGMAAVAVTFARYFAELTGWSVGDAWIAVAVLGGLTGASLFVFRKRGAAGRLRCGVRRHRRCNRL